MGQHKNIINYETDGKQQVTSIIGKDLKSDHTHSPIKAKRNLSKDLSDVNQMNDYQDGVTNQYRKMYTTFEKDVIDVSKMNLIDH